MSTVQLDATEVAPHIWGSIVCSLQIFGNSRDLRGIPAELPPARDRARSVV